MPESPLESLNVRLERGTYAIQTSDGETYVIATFADSESRAYLGINGGALEPVVIGSNKLDGPHHDWTEPVISVGSEFVAREYGQEELVSAPVVSIAPLGADATSDSILTNPIFASDEFIDMSRSSHHA